MALLAGVGFAQVLLVNEPMLAGRLASLKKRLFRPSAGFSLHRFLAVESCEPRRRFLQPCGSFVV